MSIDKRKLLWALAKNKVWKNLSLEEIRLYFLLVVFADTSNGEGRLTYKELDYYLGFYLHREKLKTAARNLEKLGLIKIKFPLDKLEIEYKILNEGD